MPTTDEFRARLREWLEKAEREGKKHLDVISGNLHRAVGGYPAPDHQMPKCCSVMKSEMQDGDEILPGAPPSGKGATLEIHYLLGNRFCKADSKAQQSP